MLEDTLLHGRAFAALLFDMDGTLLSSIEVAERNWTRWAERHGLDVETFLPTVHGVRAVETIRRQNLPGIDAEREAAVLGAAEMDDMEGVTPIAGVGAFLAALPAHRWAIVTSAPRDLAIRRLEVTGLPVPGLLISAEDVENGKPQPDCYLLAAARLGVPAEDCLVLEDAPAGIAAGEAAGASVLVVAATHREPMATPHPSIKGYGDLAIVVDDTGSIRIRRPVLVSG